MKLNQDFPKDVCDDKNSTYPGIGINEQHKLMWNELFSKFSEESSSSECFEISNDESITNAICLPVNQSNASTKQSKLENQMLPFQETEKEQTKQKLQSTIMTIKDVVRVVREFIENKLKSKLNYYYIKGMSSRIKRDRKEAFWIGLVIMELKNLKKKLNDVYIELYLAHLFPSCPLVELCDYIENNYKSNLKYFFHLRRSEPMLEALCNVHIEQEWNNLRRHVSEKYICLYHSTICGIQYCRDPVAIVHKQHQQYLDDWSKLEQMKLFTKLKDNTPDSLQSKYHLQNQKNQHCVLSTQSNNNNFKIHFDNVEVLERKPKLNKRLI